jgi:lactoylglutathione lyase
MGSPHDGMCHDVWVELTQTRLIVDDFAAAFRYYRDVVGLKPQFDGGQPPYAAFKPDEGGTLALHDRTDLAAVLDGELRASDRSTVCLRVADLDAYLAEVTARGARVLADPVVQDGRIRTAYLRDPEGNLIEIQQWLATR